MGEYTIENVYEGGYSTLDPNKAYSNTFTGYRATAGSLGLTTDPRTANIIKDASAKLSSGVKQIELTLVTPELFDSVPKQHLQEIKEVADLTGVNVSVHAPVIDSAGIGRQGFSELERENAERKITDYIKRSHEVNPDGNIPVVFHTSEGIPGSEWKQIPWKEKGVKGQAGQIIAINQETGQMTPVKPDVKYYPGMKDLKPGVEEKLESGQITQEEFAKNREKYFEEPPLSKGKIYTPEQNLEMMNDTEWDNKISQLFFNKERADEILQQNALPIQHLLEEINSGKINPNSLTNTQKEVWHKFKDAQNYLKEINMQARGLFSKAYEFGDSRQRKELEVINEQYKKNLEKNKGDVVGQSKAMHSLLLDLQERDLAPEMYIPIEKFATEQSSKTFGNAAYGAYKKFKDKAPVICIENPPAGFALSTGEDLKNLVVASRNQFVERLINEEKMDKKKAEQTAEKLIGATWDVGHINMIRKQGFEDSDIVKETEKVAPYVKHVHLSDNFGLEHTELPMGMGNVPMKEIMERLGKQGFEGRKIIEAGQWWQHFQTNPLKESLEGMGSPMYSVDTGPYWNQSIGLQQNYFGGYGMMLPQGNYNMWGAGFSQLPSELGGQAGGGQGSRMSGRGME